MFEEAQDQTEGFEAAGSPKTTSPEAQLNQLVNTVDRTDQAYGGKVVTRIPTEDGKEVFIFNSVVLAPEGGKPLALTGCGDSAAIKALGVLS